MATFRLRRFSNPEALKAIRTAYLLELLQPHSGYFNGRGLSLDVINGGELDYEQLVHILMNPDERIPGELVDDLYYVHEMATPDGMDELLEAVREQPAGSRVDLDLPPDVTPADVAVQVRLRAPELLERRHAEHFLTSKRSFEYYQARPGADLDFESPDADTLSELEDALDDRLDQLKRGRTSKVFVFERDDGVWFLIRHGQPCKREGSLTESGTETVYYRPEIYDVLRYDQRTGELSMNAETKKIGQLYREKLGLYLFGDAAFFPGTGKYTLQPILDDGEACLVCTDVDGIEWVKLKEIQIFWGGPENEIEVRKATDVFAVYRRRERSIRGRLIRANFSVKFADSRTPRTVSIRPSNVASYTRDADAVLVEDWLARRGFAMTAGASHDDRPQPAVAHA